MKKIFWICNCWTKYFFVLLFIVSKFLFLGNSLQADFTNGQNASLVIGQPNFTTRLATTTQNGLNCPNDIIFDIAGNLWIVDGMNHRILKYIPPFANGMNTSLVIGQNNFLTAVATTSQNSLGAPYGATFDSFGNLWIADFWNHRVLRYVPPLSNGMNASLVIGQSDFTSGVATTTQSGLFHPRNPIFDNSGNLWVVDYNNHRVLRYNHPFVTGMDASLVIGQDNFSGRKIATAPNGLNYPCDMVFDNFGNLWVADFYNFRVLKYAPPFSNGMNASLVIGQSDFTSATATTTQNGLSAPRGITFDNSGNLWVADGNRILRYTSPFANGMAASLVIGQNDFTTAVGTTSVNGLYIPSGITFDNSGNLWVADFGNHRALKFSPISIEADSGAKDVKVYPNPFVPFDDIDDNGKPYNETDSQSGIIFCGLTDPVKIVIYMITGEPVRGIEKDDTGGTYRWDARNDNGEEVASGGYIYVVNSGGKIYKGKIAIIR